MKYRCVIWCPDCTGEDPQGCFDGGSDIEVFDTKEEAIAYGEKCTAQSIWRYDTEEVSE